MAADDELHAVLHVVEGVEHGEEALAGNGERVVGAVDHELLDEDAPAGARRVRHQRCLTT